MSEYTHNKLRVIQLISQIVTQLIVIMSDDQESELTL